MKLSLCNFLHYPVTSTFSLSLRTLRLCSSQNVIDRTPHSQISEPGLRSLAMSYSLYNSLKLRPFLEATPLARSLTLSDPTNESFHLNFRPVRRLCWLSTKKKYADYDKLGTAGLLKMGPRGCPETSVPNYQSTPRNIPFTPRRKPEITQIQRFRAPPPNPEYFVTAWYYKPQRNPFV